VGHVGPAHHFREHTCMFSKDHQRHKHIEEIGLVNAAMCEFFAK